MFPIISIQLNKTVKKFYYCKIKVLHIHSIVGNSIKTMDTKYLVPFIKSLKSGSCVEIFKKGIYIFSSSNALKQCFSNF